jgi:hypothetical protein
MGRKDGKEGWEGRSEPGRVSGLLADRGKGEEERQSRMNTNDSEMQMSEAEARKAERERETSLMVKKARGRGGRVRGGSEPGPRVPGQGPDCQLLRNKRISADTEKDVEGREGGEGGGDERAHRYRDLWGDEAEGQGSAAIGG